nr:hypothetical protein CFP56_24658 [Quercus suber]
MRSSSILTVLPLTAATAILGPRLLFRRDSNMCTSFQVDQNGGQVTCTSGGVGKQTINIGDCALDDIFPKLAEACVEGTCDETVVPWPTTIWSKYDSEPGNVTITPHGGYPIWMRNGLLGALEGAVKAVANCTQGTYSQVGSGLLLLTSLRRKSAQRRTLTLWFLDWAVIHESSECTDCGPATMEFEISMQEADGDLCQDMIDSSKDGFDTANTLTLGAGSEFFEGADALFTFAGLFCEDHSSEA